MKTFFETLQPRVVNYIDYKYFENDRLGTDLLSELGKAGKGKKAIKKTGQKTFSMHVKEH